MKNCIWLLCLAIFVCSAHPAYGKQVVYNVSDSAWTEVDIGPPPNPDIEDCRGDHTNPESGVWCYLKADGCFATTFMEALDLLPAISAAGDEAVDSGFGRLWLATPNANPSGGIVSCFYFGVGSGAILLTSGEGGAAIDSMSSFEMPDTSGAGQGESFVELVTVSVQGAQGTTEEIRLRMAGLVVASTAPTSISGGAGGTVTSGPGATAVGSGTAQLTSTAGHGSFPIPAIVTPLKAATPQFRMKCLEAILSLESGRTHATVFANGNALPGMWNIGKARVNGEAKIQVIITAPGGCP